MSEFNNIMDYLNTIPKFGNGIGFQRVHWLIRNILSSKWGKTIDAFHVTGSNGKGSTVKFIGSILSELGIKTGIFISPHLFKFNERISIDNKVISNNELEKLIKWIKNEIKKYNNIYENDTIGGFEVIFTIAINYFYRKKINALVLEAGIGGRYDTTRIIRGKTNILTSVDLEHTNLLGHTKELIAYDKADICKEKDDLFVGNIDKDLKKRFDLYCELKNINVKYLNEFSLIKEINYKNDFMFASFNIDDIEFHNVKYNLIGRFQVENSILAVKAVMNWCNWNKISIDKKNFIEAVHNSFSKINLKGRLEKILNRPPIYVDVGHTPMAIDKMILSIKEIWKKKYIILITGVSIDKEVKQIVDKLGRISDHIICSKANYKGSNPNEIYSYLKKTEPLKSIEIRNHLNNALKTAISIAKEKDNSVILVAGGLFLAAEATAYIEHNKKVEELVFF